MTEEVAVPIRVYADTSVFGGAFDEEFEKASKAFFDQVESGRFELVISETVRDELVEAPANVREYFESFASSAVIVPPTQEALLLRRAYLEAEIVGERWTADALHVALASTSRCDAIVSWNFRHIVHFQKIALYNEINGKEGYGEIAIHTPQEVIDYED
jgi:predicted nucleic acid-binding protein